MPEPSGRLPLIAAKTEATRGAGSASQEPITVRPPSGTRLRLVVYTRRGQEHVELAPAGVVGIGRGPENVVRLDDPMVSRSHARLHLGTEVEVEDLGSANGSTIVRNLSPGAEPEDTQSLWRVQLEPHQRVRFHAGDVLRIGRAIITFETVPEGSREEQSGPVTGGAPPVLADREMRHIHALARRTAKSDMSVLILGETGVGKEVLAETIHRASHRAKSPFLRFNCAAFAPNLVESELFGHERGAFTGAHANKIGLLESTNGGTLFMDEVGELSAGIQAKLLRVLEERSVTRLGATKPQPADVRFVTATNRDLARDVRDGRFRSDLFYRIGGMVLTIPPLRHRLVEVEPLARYFLKEFCRRSGRIEPHLTPAAVERLLGHDWPGNVRELKNVMERATLLATGAAIDFEHVALETPSQLDDATGDEAETTVVGIPNTFARSLQTGATDGAELEKERVISALEACGGNQTRAAKLLGVSRRTLVNRIDGFSLPRPRK
jgi:two-component system, NtrC family, response regulator AtoC